MAKSMKAKTSPSRKGTVKAVKAMKAMKVAMKAMKAKDAVEESSTEEESEEESEPPQPMKGAKAMKVMKLKPLSAMKESMTDKLDSMRATKSDLGQQHDEEESGEDSSDSGDDSGSAPRCRDRGKNRIFTLRFEELPDHVKEMFNKEKSASGKTKIINNAIKKIDKKGGKSAYKVDCQKSLFEVVGFFVCNLFFPIIDIYI